jgi:hypothetical protein
LERLEIGPKVVFSESDTKVIRKIQKYRNRFEHYKFSVNKFEINKLIIDFIDVIDRFLINELKIDRFFRTCYAKYEFIYPTTHINKGFYCF